MPFGLSKPNVKKMEERGDVDGLIAALEHEDKGVRSEAARSLGRIGNARAVEPLVKALRDQVEPVRDSAVESLGRIGEPAVEVLARTLSGESYDMVRWQLVRALGETRNPKALEPLIDALKDTDETVRRLAIEALAKIGEAAIGPLIHSLRDRGERDIKYGAAVALGKIGNARAVEPLVEALRNEGPAVRQGAIFGLVDIGKPAVESVMRLYNQTLKEDDTGARMGAVIVLANIADARALDVLTQAKGDKDSFVRGKAEWGLKRIGSGKS